MEIINTPEGPRVTSGDGGYQAVTAAGHLVSAKALKDGMRWATPDDVAAVEAHAAKLAAADKAKAKPAGPLA